MQKLYEENLRIGCLLYECPLISYLILAGICTRKLLTLNEITQ